jgi:glutamyl-tRNA synthetase
LVPKKLSAAETRPLLEAAREALAGLSVWETRAIEAALRGLAEQRGVKVGDLFTPIRVAVTGSTASPPLFETLAVLGPERVMARLQTALARLHQ